MKKNFFYATALVLGLAFTATACSDDDDNSTVNPADIEYNSENAASWHNYMRNVAALLKTDATNLYDSWNTSYKGGASFATSFKAHNGAYNFSSAWNCIEQVIDGETVAEVLDYVQYSPKKLLRTLETWVSQSVKEGRISLEEGKEFLSNYRSGLYGYTYLE